MNVEKAYLIDPIETDADLYQRDPLSILSEDFDDEDFLTSRAMYHCWSDRPRSHGISTRRAGRRRPSAKNVRKRIIGHR